MTESQELLAKYVRDGSESAFRRLVELYSGLVYSTALRLVDGDAHRAKDVAQTVFIDLARMAEKLTANSMLGGWLHRHTCFVASTLMRGERRRQAREQVALAMNTLSPQDESNFTAIAPVLDEAIHRLGADDRDLILLRFFEHKNLRQVGESLGISENVAQKRVARALDELRLILGHRGTQLSVVSLGTILAAKAVTAAPVGMIAELTIAAIASTGAVPAASGAALMAKAKTALILALLAVSMTSTYLLFKKNRQSSPTPVIAAAEVQPEELPVPQPTSPQRRVNPPTPIVNIPVPAPSDSNPPEADAVESPPPSQSVNPPTASVPLPAFTVPFKSLPGSSIRIDGHSKTPTGGHPWYMVGSMIGGSFELNALTNAKAQAIIAVRAIHSVAKVGSSIMDGLYQEALKEKQFPKIIYNLRQMQPADASGHNFSTVGDLAIAGVTNRISMLVTLALMEDGRLRISGSTPLKMTDYGVIPPAPSFGLGTFHCDENVTVSFEWNLTIPSINAGQQSRTVLPSGESGGSRTPSPDHLRNLAFGIMPTSSDHNAREEMLARITDGTTSADSKDICLLRKGPQWVNIDLGSINQIVEIRLWHSFDTPKKVHDVIVQASNDPKFFRDVRTLFNNDGTNRSGVGVGTNSEYMETASGLRIPANQLAARYLRFHSRGSTDTAMNEYTEIEVWGE